MNLRTERFNIHFKKLYGDNPEMTDDDKDVIEAMREACVILDNQDEVRPHDDKMFALRAIMGIAALGANGISGFGGERIADENFVETCSAIATGVFMFAQANDLPVPPKEHRRLFYRDGFVLLFSHIENKIAREVAEGVFERAKERRAKQ